MIKGIFDRKIHPVVLFAIGALFGAIAFVGIYGVQVLDFTNNGWLFYGDNDLRQHYIAWCNYRRDPWHFPIGLIDSLSYPNSVSIIYTDSIPIFAVFFKIFRSILPETFQYFGLFGILSYILMGGFSATLLRRFINNDIVCVIGSGFYIFSFQMLQRMYYHTALSAQWLIILAIILWVNDSRITGTVRKIIYWGLMGFLCVGIHSYFLPMVGMILMAVMIQQFIFSYGHDKKLLDAIKLPLAEFTAFCILGIAELYILGGFYGGAGGYAGGLGSFNANLNTFINPIEYGSILPKLPMYHDFQYEGFGYLGAGILFLYLMIVIGMIFRLVRKTKESAFHTSNVPGRLTLLVVICSVLTSTLPLLSYGDKKIVWFPYPGIVERVLGIFRSNGRLIWVAVYILMTAAIAFAAYTFRQDKPVAVLLITIALVIQIYDGKDAYRQKYEYFSKEYPIYNMWDDPELSELTIGKDRFIFLYTDNDVTLFTAYYGYQHNMQQNNYYYARDIDDKIRAGIDEYMAELSEGNMRDDAVYVITEQMYTENKEFYDNLEGRKLDKYDHFIFTR